MAAIYKGTKSVFACAFCHAFIDSIGAGYDWNALFDAFPGSVSVNVFRAVWFGAAIAIWVWGERKERKIINKPKTALVATKVLANK